MDEASAPPSRPGGNAARLDPTAATEMAFVTPWADEPAMVVDITGEEPALGGPGTADGTVARRELLAMLTAARAEIQALQGEIRRLRSAQGGEAD